MAYEQTSDALTEEQLFWFNKGRAPYQNQTAAGTGATAISPWGAPSSPNSLLDQAAIRNMMTTTDTALPVTNDPSAFKVEAPDPASRYTPGEPAAARAPETPYEGGTGGDLGTRAGVSPGVRQALMALNTPSAPVVSADPRPSKPSPDAERQTVRGLMKGRR